MTAPGWFALGYRRDDADVVVELQGELDVASAPELRHALADLIDDQGNLSLVIDLRDVEFIDSTGLAVLAHAQQRLRSRGGQMVLDNPRPATRKALEISGLGAILPIRPEEGTEGQIQD